MEIQLVTNHNLYVKFAWTIGRKEWTCLIRYPIVTYYMCSIGPALDHRRHVATVGTTLVGAIAQECSVRKVPKHFTDALVTAAETLKIQHSDAENETIIKMARDLNRRIEKVVTQQT